jgi:hypothetical protein
VSGITRHSTQIVRASGIVLPEFSPTRKVELPVHCQIFDAKDSRYDMILGNNALIPLGIDCLASTKTIKRDGMHIPYKPSSHFTTPTSVVSTPNQDPSMLIPNQTEANFLSVDPDSELTEYIEERICHSYVAEIKESKYEIVPLSKVAKLQTHLSSSQQDQLFDVLKDFEPLFNGNLFRTGKLGTYIGPLATLELTSDAKPFHNRPYSVSSLQKDT